MTITRCEPTHKELAMWEQTKTALMWHCPAFSHIFYTMMDRGGSKHTAIFTRDPGIPIAATDGANMIINPEGFFKMNLQERVFVAAHEILHCVYDHLNLGHHLQSRKKVTFSDGKSKPYDHGTMNRAMDLVINDTLIEAGTGAMPKNPDGTQMGMWDKKLATGKDSVIDAYRKVYEDDVCGPRGGGGTFDVHLTPGTSTGKDPHTAATDRNPTEWATAVEGGLAAARAMGRLPGALDRALSALLEPRVEWRDKIQALFARRVGSGSYDWRKADRQLIVRDIYAPGRSGHGANLIVVAGDTSGSINKETLNMFFAEIAGILDEVRPKDMHIAWCDSRLHRVDELHDASDLNEVRYKGAPGGGGTDFRPVFDWITENQLEPDALVFLTDGLGTFPATPTPYPTIWGSIDRPESHYPFGDVVMIPKQAAS